MLEQPLRNFFVCSSHGTRWPPWPQGLCPWRTVSWGGLSPNLSLLVYERRSHFPECLALLPQDGWSCPWISTQGSWETLWWRWALPGNRQKWEAVVDCWLVLSSQNTADWLGCLIHLKLAFSPLWRLKVHDGCADQTGFLWDLSPGLQMADLLVALHIYFNLCAPLVPFSLFMRTPVILN